MNAPAGENAVRSHKWWLTREFVQNGNDVLRRVDASAVSLHIEDQNIGLCFHGFLDATADQIVSGGMMSSRIGMT